MATYKEIQEFIQKKYGYCVKTCWIAHMKEVCGLPVKMANNRYSPDSLWNQSIKNKGRKTFCRLSFQAKQPRRI